MRAQSTLLFTVDEARGQIKISRTRFFELLASGEIESVKIGRSRRIPEQALAQYVDRLRRAQGGAGGDDAG